jgi:hypothetical protein
VYKGGVACSDEVLLLFVLNISKATGERNMDMIISYRMFPCKIRYFSVDVGVKGWGQPIFI